MTLLRNQTLLSRNIIFYVSLFWTVLWLGTPYICIAQKTRPAAPQSIPSTATSSPPTITTNPEASASINKLLPTDDGASDPSWVSFRSALLSSLQRREFNTLLPLIHPKIINGLETPVGLVEFKKQWGSDSQSERLLHDLSAALQLGSVWYDSSFAKGSRLLCAPYVPLRWPLEAIDPYDNGAIIVKEALIKSAPSHTSQTLGSLSYDIVNVPDWEVEDNQKGLQQHWVKIRHQGIEGFVPDQHIRSPIEYRACFTKTPAGWRLAQYVLGIEYLGMP